MKKISLWNHIFFCYWLITVTLTLAFAPQQSFAQKTCGTVVTDDYLAFEYQERMRKKNTNLDSLRLMSNNIPVKIHIVRNSNGIGGASASSILNALNFVNQKFAPNNMIFYQCGNVNYIDDNLFYYNDIQIGNFWENSLVSSNNVSNVINIYFVPQSSGSCGWAYFPWMTQDWIVMNNNCITSGSGSILAHEIGHYFGLLHTHETAGGSENVTRWPSDPCYNCNAAGDYLCDTPADSGLRCGINVNTNTCTYTGNSVDACGVPYAPQTNNMMSYSCSHCMNFFSPMQLGRMLYSYDNERNYLDGSACNPRPDLDVINSSTSPTSTTAGSTINVNYTIKNIGTGAASNSYTRFYLSTDCTLSNNDTYLGQLFLNSLSPNAISSVNQSITIPNNVSAGSYYIIVKADARNSVTESNETNNTACSSLYVNGLTILRPDLNVATASVSPTNITAGNNVTVNYTIRNIGSLAASNSYTRFYLSTDCAFSNNDIYLGEKSLISLSPNASSSTSNHTLNIPANTTAGSYYIIVRADGRNSITESNETNNTYCSGLYVNGTILLPDLNVTTANVSPTNITAGNNITVNYTIRNIGTQAASNNYTYFYLSTDCTLSNNDTYLDRRFLNSLSPNASSSPTQSLTIPANMTTGVYYLIVKADGTGIVTESDETNNTACMSLSITTAQPDLDIITASLNPTSTTAGSSINVNYIIKNIGTSAASNTYTRFYLSTDCTWSNNDTYLGEKFLINLFPNASSSVSNHILNIPSNIAAGGYYIIVKADGRNSIVESNENNNTICRTLTITNPPTCPPLSSIHLAVQQITNNSAKLVCNWTSGTSQYDWQYKQQGSGTWINFPATTVNYKTVSTLQACTNYEFRVSRKCTATNTWSNWSSPKSFTTTCNNCQANKFIWQMLGGTIDYEVSNQITATNTILSTANVTYDAGNTILLRPNFIARAGCDFLAVIDGCGGVYKGEEMPENELTTPTELQVDIYPNPFTQNAFIAFDLPVAKEVQVDVFNLAGQKVHTLLEASQQAAGKQELTFQAGDLPNGTYILRMRVGDQWINEKLVLMR